MDKGKKLSMHVSFQKRIRNKFRVDTQILVLRAYDYSLWLLLSITPVSPWYKTCNDSLQVKPKLNDRPIHKFQLDHIVRDTTST
jgi:hypothetical protein